MVELLFCIFLVDDIQHVMFCCFHHGIYTIYTVYCMQFIRWVRKREGEKERVCV